MTETARPNRPLLDAAHALSASGLTPHTAWELIGQLQGLASGMNAIATAAEDYIAALSEENLDDRVLEYLPGAVLEIFNASIALQEARNTFETLYTAHLATAESGVRQPTPPGFFGQPGQATAAISSARSAASGLPADFPTPQQVQAMTLKHLREVSRNIGFAPGNQNKADLIANLEAYRFSRSPAARRTSATVTAGRMSDKPLLPNAWEFPTSGSDICFHEDGEIGQALAAMGHDRRLDIDGEPLANVIGRIATGPVKGHTSSQEALDQLKGLRNRLPESTRARRVMDECIQRLDAPNSPVPDVPAVTPEPLRQLMKDLHAIPCVRREPAREQERLQAILSDFEHGQTRNYRLISSVRNLTGFRHELEEGWFDIRRAVTKAVAALEEALEKNRRSLIAPDRNQT
ncbi:hypothetical protein [Catelliglobosispora koreensis]|uniref:hypothetical protein n=1 Tax=Catelliglobosispora koreensis TaxID=129052 RepID=UPI00036A9AFD|nr:hypothetical protein [Catelliglobosispora koreensis]